MSIIKILPNNLINQIAAGEVIERPSSVVKELVENSIDAGATALTITLKEGGGELVEIKDNGCGMSKEDLELSIKRHATSKITKENDLWALKTMGFRGEALSSIASVSKLTISTKTQDNLSGFKITAQDGEVSAIEEVAVTQGTIISVLDLFYNTPARKKYLKKISTELGHITTLINNIALANPSIAFKVIHNGKIIINYASVNEELSRIVDVFGKDTAEALIPVFYGSSELKITGYVGKPVLSRSTSKHQYFFVNGRAIQHHLLANTIKRAFHSLLMENKKPFFLVNIEIDPSQIDVNVHPRKLEIRFENQQFLIKTIYGVVKTALEKTILTPKGFTESKRYMSDGISNSSQNSYTNQSANSTSQNFNTPSGSAFKYDTNIQQPKERFRLNDNNFENSVANFNQTPKFTQKKQIQPALEFSKEFIGQSTESQTGYKGIENTPVKVIAQISNSYILAKDENGLVIIDQHAAHERVRYELLMDFFENQERSVQGLTVPIQIDLTNEESTYLKENVQDFLEIGFEIDYFGGNTFLIQSVPSFFVKEDIKQVFHGVLDDIMQHQTPSKLQGRIEDVINSMSCRSAIKFGQTLTMPEMEALVKQLGELKRPYTCPHGRPTVVNLSLDELHKMFGRK